MEITQERIAEMCKERGCMSYNHIRLKKWEKDRAVVDLYVTEDNLNYHGITHGGVLFTMADCVAGIAAFTDGNPYVTISSSFNYLRGSKLGEHLEAVGVIRRRGRNTCYGEVEITSRSTKKLLATGSFTYYRVNQDASPSEPTPAIP